jgi:hypothetical protein
MIANNRRIKKTNNLLVFKFEMIAKDCDINQRDFQSWGLTPTEGKKHVMFLTETIDKINYFISILISNGVVFSYKDITNSVLLMINVDNLFRRAYDYNESFKWSIDTLRFNKLSQDDVLDKINKYGKKSLDHIDIKLLKSF